MAPLAERAGRHPGHRTIAVSCTVVRSRGRGYAGGVDTIALFLASDSALRSVIDRVTPDDLDKPAPSEWSSHSDPTIRTILGAHAYDEAWIPAVLAGLSVTDGDELRGRDLLGESPIAAYDAINEIATAAVLSGVDPGATFHFQYGDYPAGEGLLHLAIYRAFQAWSIAKYLAIPFHLSPDLIAGLNEHVMPHAEEFRGFGVFPPAIEPPAHADAETRLLCSVGYWIP